MISKELKLNAEKTGTMVVGSPSALDKFCVYTEKVLGVHKNSFPHNIKRHGIWDLKKQVHETEREPI